jgi:hypothetical protein
MPGIPDVADMPSIASRTREGRATSTASGARPNASRPSNNAEIPKVTPFSAVSSSGLPKSSTIAATAGPAVKPRSPTAAYTDVALGKR